MRPRGHCQAIVARVDRDPAVPEGSSIGVPAATATPKRGVSSEHQPNGCARTERPDQPAPERSVAW